MNAVTLGACDVYQGLGAWRMWWMLAKNDVVRRYRRSRLGQFWLTLSMAVMIFGMGSVYSVLFGMSIADYMPHLAVGLVVWGLISQTINESCSSFTENENIIRQVSLPKFTYILRTLTRNTIVFAHNLLIIPIIIIIAKIPINASVFLILPGFALVIANLAWIGFFFAILSTRFRDIPQIVQSVMQVAFFISPVVFKPSQLRIDHPLLIMNPFANMIEVMREPLLGQYPSISAYIFLFAMLLGGWIMILAFSGKYGHRVVYWL